MPGRLVLCATPIGNLGDIPPRLGAALAEADTVYAEDTRRAAVLLSRLGVEGGARSFFVGNERERSEELHGRLLAGETVALITDAGTPGVADPGLTAVRAARAAGAEVTIVPGPSAVTAALAASGMPADRFVFEGFLPRKSRSRLEVLSTLAAERRTIVVFASPHRFLDDLVDLAAHLGPEREVCVCRELTKQHEEVWWGTLASAHATWTEREPRGEFTVVVAGAEPRPVGIEEAVAVGRRVMATGASRSEAARRAASETGASRREVYERLGEASE